MLKRYCDITGIELPDEYYVLQITRVHPHDPALNNKPACVPVEMSPFAKEDVLKFIRDRRE